MPSFVTPPLSVVLALPPAALPSTVTVWPVGIVPLSVEPPSSWNAPPPALSVSVALVRATGLPVCWAPAVVTACCHVAPLDSEIAPALFTVAALTKMSRPVVRLSSPAGMTPPWASTVTVPSLVIIVFWSRRSSPLATTIVPSVALMTGTRR